MRFARVSLSTLCGLLLLPAGWLTLTACNALTGVNDIELSADDDDDGGQTAGAGASGQTAGQGGASGAATSGAATSGAATTGAGGMATASSNAASTGSGPGPCTYPVGPYGVGLGDTVPSNISWQGYAPGAATPSTVSTKDFFDCDGAKGIHAILFDTSQFG
jgi:hypothetical protein